MLEIGSLEYVVLTYERSVRALDSAVPDQIVYPRSRALEILQVVFRKASRKNMLLILKRCGVRYVAFSDSCIGVGPFPLRLRNVDGLLIDQSACVRQGRKNPYK